MNRWRRRFFLQGAAVAGASTVLFGPDAAMASVPTGGKARVATVIGSGESGQVEVSVGRGDTRIVATAFGFPPGWRLRPGDRVVLTVKDPDGSERVVMPLVRRIVAPADQIRLSHDTSVSVSGTNAELLPATVRGPTNGSTKSLQAVNEVYLIDNDYGRDPACLVLRPVETSG
jgi:hypothetical protein